MSSKFSRKANEISKILTESSMYKQKNSISLRKNLTDIYKQYESKGFKMLFIIQDNENNKITEFFSHHEFKLAFAYHIQKMYQEKTFDYEAIKMSKK